MTTDPRWPRSITATLTTEGVIPHLLVPMAAHPAGRFFAPVRVAVEQGSDIHAPVRRDGRLVFALPGGGEVLA